MELKVYRKDGSQIIPEFSPDDKHRFFLFDRSDPEDYYFETVEDRDLYFKAFINDLYYESDGWNAEAIEQIIAGEITHFAKVTNRVNRPPDSELGIECINCDEKTEGCRNKCGEWFKDKDGNDWDGDHDHVCDYSLVSIDETCHKNEDE